MTKVELKPLTVSERLLEFALRIYWKFRPPVYGVLMGGPGAGKGTLAEGLAPDLEIAHTSTGNLLRREIAAGTAIGRFVAPIMAAGDFVPDEITLYLLARELRQWKNRHGAILDGFPRSLEQAELLQRLLSGWGSSLTAVILIAVPEADLIERIAGRRTCSNSDCGRSYHIKFQPPSKDGICDNCGSELIQRSDDNEVSILNRLAIYNEKTAPLVGFYDRSGLLHRVSSTNSGGKEDTLRQARAFFSTQRKKG
ncbi:MAG: adenylate kinase family protein [Candidatus Obscuribacterales bacterium]